LKLNDARHNGHSGQFYYKKRQIKLECKTDWAFNTKAFELNSKWLCPSQICLFIFFSSMYIHLDQDDNLFNLIAE